jgi:beta-N-acetylhexosaminidase
MSRSISVFLRIFTILSLLLAFIPGDHAAAQPLPQQSTQAQKAAALLNRMTPEQRVGQVFLITFNGSNVGADTKINDLIKKYYIGGVMLKAANDNFSDADTSLKDIHTMTADLQRTAWNNTQANSGATSSYVPLFVGLSQEGNGSPNDQILNGVSTLPDLMSIGATWKPDLAQAVGKEMGQELNALGINLYFGPSLDVHDANLLEADDLGTRTFGGNSYWVGEMGKSYIKGLHEGSQQHMAVISKHFPGRGGSDRPPDEEVATVRKSMDQLIQVDLAPFFGVAANQPEPLMVSDGFLVPHIRYQSIQGNIRVTTRPVSFDQTALEQLLGLAPINQWHSSGGIMVSDDLGSAAVKKFFDPTGQSFDARQVARSAFLAGNDLLYMDNFVATGDPDKYATLARTLDFFNQKYREDPAFAKRIDASVLRLLTLKYRLYDDFTLSQVIPATNLVSNVSQGSQVAFEVAQNAATLINPSLTDLNSTLPHSPELGDKLVFFTDSTTFKSCSQCKDQTNLAVDAMQRSVIKLYGPQSGAQVLQYRLSSYGFTDLLNYLNGNTSQLPTIEDDVRSANWLVFAITNISKDRPTSMALKRFLSERPQLLQDKKIIVFAFDAPYYLDATDISKITAYYALYSKGSSFVEAAVRILFQELVPAGELPVSVPAIGYDLSVVVSPDPTQVLPLSVDMDVFNGQHPTPTGSVPTTQKITPTPRATNVPLFKVGDTIPLVAGEILDHNRNVVPNGTIVRFVFVTGGEAGTTQQIEAPTTNGMARAVYRIQSPGFIEIRVMSEQATVSEILRLDISGTQAAAITAIAPTIFPTNTPAPTNTPLPTATITPITQPKDKQGVPGFADWIVSVGLILAVSLGMYQMGRRRISLRWGVRWGFMAAIGGLLGYLLVVIVDRGKSWTDDPFQFFGFLFTGMLVGWAVSWVWQKLE